MVLNMDSLENRLDDIQKTLHHILIELAKLEVRVDERGLRGVHVSKEERELVNR